MKFEKEHFSVLCYTKCNHYSLTVGHISSENYLKANKIISYLQIFFSNNRKLEIQNKIGTILWFFLPKLFMILLYNNVIMICNIYNIYLWYIINYKELIRLKVEKCFQFYMNYTNQAQQLTSFHQVGQKTKMLKNNPFLTTSTSN